MTDFFILDLLNTCLRVAVTLIVTFKLVEFYHDYRATERLGLGLMGAGSFLTVPPIWSYSPGEGVYDHWAVSVMTIGIILLLIGRMIRHIDHRARNAAAPKVLRDSMDEWRRERGE